VKKMGREVIFGKLFGDIEKFFNESKRKACIKDTKKVRQCDLSSKSLNTTMILTRHAMKN
jgi:hypothetical protein